MQPLAQKFSELLIVCLSQRRVILSSLLSQPQLASVKVRLLSCMDLTGPIMVFPF